MKARIVTLALALAACEGSAYNMGYRASYGNAGVQPGSSRGLTTTIAYRDYNGILGKSLLLFLLAPSRPTGHSSVSSERSCAGDTCTITTTTTHTGPTAGEISRYEHDVDTYTNTIAPAVLSGAFQVEGVLEVSTQSLGGDTSGMRLGLNWTLASDSTFSIKAGFAVGQLISHGRTSHRLVGDPMSLHLEDSGSNLRSSIVAIPLRLAVSLASTVSAYAQLDLNLLRVFDGDGVTDDPKSSFHPEITHFGIETLRSHIRLGVELQVESWHTDSTSIGAEAGFAF